jgi:hypothetical protein
VRTASFHSRRLHDVWVFGLDELGTHVVLDLLPVSASVVAIHVLSPQREPFRPRTIITHWNIQRRPLPCHRVSFQGLFNYQYYAVVTRRPVGWYMHRQRPIRRDHGSRFNRARTYILIQ